MTRAELVNECQRLAKATLEENHWASRVLTSLALSIFTETEEVMATELDGYVNAQQHAMRTSKGNAEYRHRITRTEGGAE
jgi:hypothetical protein